MPDEPPLILFDMDGTLVNLPNIQSAVFEHAMANTYGIATSLSQVPIHGATHYGIALALGALWGIDEETISAGFAEFTRLAGLEMDRLLRDYGQPLSFPRIREMAAALQSAGYQAGIMTGNPREVGEAVLRHAGLDGFFLLRHFSGRHRDRNELLAGVLDSMSGNRKVVIVGDTPADIIASHHFGLPAVAVTTGIFRSELDFRDCHPELICPCLDATFPQAIAGLLAG